MDTLQAAIVLAKLPSFPSEVRKRSEIGALYSELLKDVCVIPAIDHGNTHVYAQYTIRVPNREELGKSLKEHGVPTAVYYPKCLHEQPVYSYLGYQWGEFPNCELASREVISLPMHPFLSDEDVKSIVSHLKNSLRSN
jgi:UDP-2-acetamido-2-deoxy-ribo-hexuluronate aminotransferase